MKELPYDFDLLYDVKNMWDVEAIAKGLPHRSDATKEDLAELFIKLDMELPDCLKGIKFYHDVWLKEDGTWSKEKPEGNCRFARILSFN